MSVPCQLIGDLLPLYYDQVCSDDSRVLVEEHLKTCPACRQALADLREQMEHPQEDMEGMREAQGTWKRSQKKSFWKGILLAVIILLAAASPLWLTLPKNQPVPAEDIKISQVCQLEDGSIVFHMYIDDGKELNNLDFGVEDDGCFYIKPMHSIIEADRESEQGLFNLYLGFYFYDQENRADDPKGKGNWGIPDSVPAVYVGTPGDAVLVWEKGQELPAASPAMERMMENYQDPLINTMYIDWDQYYDRIERALGDEMFQKEDAP